MNNQQKQQVIEQIKSAGHVLVTVSSNPTVDELAASIGLTLALNKMDKHATTVFSGIVPSTIEFLQPEKTIETTTDSLRDFIIALDKSKADKLRYKVEDDVVRIFITPYRTSITDKDLDFSQGDFNVDLVLAIGITQKQDLDKAITSHGRILHDATIVGLTKREAVSELGSINWQEQQASSLCEMVASIVVEMQPEIIDGQMATSFLTGIIAETDRFKNDRTTPLALSLSSQLMTAGANQQLIAEKLDEPEIAPSLHVDEPQESPQENGGSNGELSINHSDDVDNIHIDDDGNLNLAPPADNITQSDNAELPMPEVPESSQEPAAEPENENQSRYIQTDQTANDNDVEEQEKSTQLDDYSDKDTDGQDEPTLKQPESSDTPMMQHERVITPPVRPGDIPKTDKPFDINEAMQTAGTNQVEQEPALEAAPEQVAENPEPVEVAEETPTYEAPAVESETPQVETPVFTVPEPVANPVAEPTPAPVPLPEPTNPVEEPAVETPQLTEQSEPISAPPVVIDSLADLEKTVGSSHVIDEAPSIPPELAAAQESVLKAAGSAEPQFPEPTEAIGSHPINLDHPKVDNEPNKSSSDPNSPPPVPPPMSPKFYDSDGSTHNPFLNPPQ